MKLIHYRPAMKNLTGCGERNEQLPGDSTTTNVANVRCLACIAALADLVQEALNKTVK